MSSPVESLQHRIICQRNLIHEKHSSFFHSQDQGAIMPVKQPAVFIISLQKGQKNSSHNQLQVPHRSNQGLLKSAKPKLMYIFLSCEQVLVAPLLFKIGVISTATQFNMMVKEHFQSSMYQLWKVNIILTFFLRVLGKFVLLFVLNSIFSVI